MRSAIVCFAVIVVAFIVLDNPIEPQAKAQQDCPGGVCFQPVPTTFETVSEQLSQPVQYVSYTSEPVVVSSFAPLMPTVRSSCAGSVMMPVSSCGGTMAATNSLSARRPVRQVFQRVRSRQPVRSFLRRVIGR